MTSRLTIPTRWPESWCLSIVALVLTLCSPVAGKAGTPHPLSTLPAEQLIKLAPLLRSCDIVLLESEPDGSMKQLTVLSLSSASPSVVHDVVIHPERYGDFVRNMTRSEVTKLPDGSLEHSYDFSYKILEVGGVHRYQVQPGPSAPVELFDTAPYSDGSRHFRWEFLPAGDGTLIAMYGYIDLSRSGGVIERLRSRFRTLDFGMGLVGQMSLVLAMKGRAEQISGPARTLPVPGNVDYSFLLDRGTVVLLRSQNGRLQELSLIDRSAAPPAQTLGVAQRLAEWSSFVPSIQESRWMGTESGIPVIELMQNLPLLSFTTRFGVQTSAAAVDLMGLSGDLSRSRLRVDVQSAPLGRSQLLFRSTQDFGRASFVLRQLYKLEPLFEYGVNVGLALLIERGIRSHAEGLPSK